MLHFSSQNLDCCWQEQNLRDNITELTVLRLLRGAVKGLRTYKPQSKGRKPQRCQRLQKAVVKHQGRPTEVGQLSALAGTKQQLGKQEPKCSQTWEIVTFPAQEPNFSCKGPLHVHRTFLCFMKSFVKACTEIGVCDKHKGLSKKSLTDPLQPLAGCDENKQIIQRRKLNDKQQIRICTMYLRFSMNISDFLQLMYTI